MPHFVITTLTNSFRTKKKNFQEQQMCTKQCNWKATLKIAEITFEY